MFELLLIFLITCFGLISGMYLIYWLIIEMPVLLRIKHEEVYNKWRDR
jgi:hypothetical protein